MLTFTFDFDSQAKKKFSLIKRMVWTVALLAFAISVSICFIAYFSWPSAAEKQHMVLFALTWTLSFTVISFLFRNRKQRERYVLVIDDDEMRMRLDYSALISVDHLQRKVRRDQIRAIYERKQGLVVSKHNRLGTFFLGCVWIPKALPEYEFIKNLALSWKTESRTSGSS